MVFNCVYKITDHKKCSLLWQDNDDKLRILYTKYLIKVNKVETTIIIKIYDYELLKYC